MFRGDSEYGKNLFGHIDCPELENPKYDPIAAYTNDRSVKLNMAHPVVQALIPFIGASLEQVRQELVEEGKKAKADADRKRLKETTNQIEQILNADLKEFRERLEGVGRPRPEAPLPAPDQRGDDEPMSNVLDPEGEETGSAEGEGGGDGKPYPKPGPDPKPFPPVPDPEGNKAGEADAEGDKRVGPAADGRPRLRGGLSIDYDFYGKDYDRARWDQDERKIIINLDHPVVKLAKELPDDEATFRRLIWEIAFTGYAIALADLQFERDPALSSSDATYEIRAALRRVWANAGPLYTV